MLCPTFPSRGLFWRLCSHVNVRAQCSSEACVEKENYHPATEEVKKVFFFALRTSWLPGKCYFLRSNSDVFNQDGLKDFCSSTMFPCGFRRIDEMDDGRQVKIAWQHLLGLCHSVHRLGLLTIRPSKLSFFDLLRAVDCISYSTLGISKTHLPKKTATWLKVSVFDVFRRSEMMKVQRIVGSNFFEQRVSKHPSLLF